MPHNRPSSVSILPLASLVVALLAGWPAGGAAQDASLPDLKKDLERAVLLDDWEGTATIIREIAALETREAVEAVLKVALALEKDEVYRAVQEAISGLKGEEPISLCSEILRKDRKVGKKLGRWEMRVAIAEAFGRRKDEPTYPPLVAALEDPTLPVRLQAMRSLALRGERRAVPVLVDALERQEKSPGVLWEEARAALMKLTGQDLAEAADWRNWWAAHGDEEPAPGPDGAGDDAKKGDGKSTVSNSPTFFGVEIVSKRIVFLIDVSGSMNMWDEGKAEGETPRGTDPAGDGYSVSRTRIHRAKRELIRVVRALRSEVRFNIITFSHDLATWKKGRLVPAGTTAKASAIGWVRDLVADGGTATDEVLEAAFLVKEANTFILLSDGVVSKPSGDNPTADEVIAMVREQNRFRKVKIHTFGFDGDGNPPPGTERHPLQSPARVAEFRAMMQKMAEENDGKYTSIR